MGFPEKLRKLREEKGLTQTELGKIFSLSKQAISSYENGSSSPSKETLQRMADFFDVTVDYILDRDIPTEILQRPGRVNRPSLQLDKYSMVIELTDLLEDEKIMVTASGEPLDKTRKLKLLKAMNDPVFEPIKRTKIPIIGKIAAGLPILAEQNYDGEIEAPENMEGDFALEVQGDSMIGAGILEGDYAICRETEVASSGQIVVAIRDICPEYAEATLKYYMDNNGHPVLRAANPDYPDMPISDGYRIAGKMVGLLRYGAPHYNEYISYIGTRDIALEAWDKVIEAAAAAGIKPAFVKDMIEAQVEIAKKLREK